MNTFFRILILLETHDRAKSAIVSYAIIFFVVLYAMNYVLIIIYINYIITLTMLLFLHTLASERNNYTIGK